MRDPSEQSEQYWNPIQMYQGAVVTKEVPGSAITTEASKN